MKLKDFFLGCGYLTAVFGVSWLIATAMMTFAPRAHANLPGTKWGQQVELGTVGNSTVYKVTDEALTCLVWQPKTGGTPVVNCWGAP